MRETVRRFVAWQVAPSRWRRVTGATPIATHGPGRWLRSRCLAEAQPLQPGQRRAGFGPPSVGWGLMAGRPGGGRSGVQKNLPSQHQHELAPDLVQRIRTGGRGLCRRRAAPTPGRRGSSGHRHRSGHSGLPADGKACVGGGFELIRDGRGGVPATRRAVDSSHASTAAKAHPKSVKNPWESGYYGSMLM
jgi:hypothetical protein